MKKRKLQTKKFYNLEQGMKRTSPTTGLWSINWSLRSVTTRHSL